VKHAALLCLLMLAGNAEASYRDHPKTAELHQRLVKEHGFSESDLLQVDEALDEAERQPGLIQAERQNKEATTPLWDNYRRIHIFPRQIANGVEVLKAYAPYFDRAEREYGVPGVVIAGILGVETKYGTFTGRNRVLDALTTQGYEHPTRSPFFFSELVDFFAFCRDYHYAPTEVRGSYAGAVGFAQFMPSNYITLARDYDGDGRIDLWSMPDAIGSIANYFTRYNPPDRPAVHWRRGEPLLVPATVANLSASAPAMNTKAPNATIADWVRYGVVPSVEMPGTTAAGLIQLRRPEGYQYFLALPNFYAVMSYNPRVFYAMAVTQLAAELQAAQAAAP
jgi:membrane-bound lytic murein transglycosylase B